MSNKRDLKAYVRYDGTGRIIPGSLILNRFKPKVGDWEETPAYECCNDIIPRVLRLTFDSIENASILVGDATSVNDWNTFFDLPTNGTLFSSVTVNGNVVSLFGGSNITLRSYIFVSNTSLISIIDETGCVVSAEGYGSFTNCTNLTTIVLPELTDTGIDSFAYGCTMLTTVNLPKVTSLSISCFESCYSLETFSGPLVTSTGVGALGDNPSLNTVYLPNLTSAGSYCFYYCTSLTSINLPQLTQAGLACFETCSSLTSLSIPLCTNLGGTVGDDGVFASMIGNIITLTVPSALMTCNSGNPDGDIQYLQANNTVTIITT